MRKRDVVVALGLAAVCVLVWPSSALAVGEAIAPSVSIAPSARGEGMGRAYVAISDDATTLWWNPAGLAFISDRNIAAMHTKLAPGLADDVYYEYLAYAQGAKDWGGVGACLVYLTYGEIEGRDEFNNLTEVFSSYEISPCVGYGTSLWKNMGIGVSMKIVHVNYAPSSVVTEDKPGKGTTFAADLGVLYKGERWGFGACLQNIGPNLTLIDADQSSPLNRNLKFGVAGNIWEGDLGRLIGAFDVNLPLVYVFDDPIEETLKDPIFGGGGEFLFSELLAVRLGFITEKYYSDNDYPIEGLTFGLGLQYKGFRFDYANIPQSKELEERVSKFAFSARF
jgi:hypothetical protein